MKCDNCGSEDSYIKNFKHSYIIKGKKIEFDSNRRFCKKCNSLVYDEELDNQASEIAISKYNEKYGITKDKIIELRKKYNLSQELFSKVIGCAKKTLISYEKGKSIPNDSYLIILKCLNSNPNLIKNIINANKDQFTEKEFIKINSKVDRNFLENKMKSKDRLVSYLSEYNGYSLLSEDKVYNVILYFAKNGIYKTKLLKEMFYADFLYYKYFCKSITGLVYAKLPYGPVPDQYEYILNECFKKNLIDYNIKITNQFECHEITSKKEFNSSIFDKQELKILHKIKEKFVKFGSKEIEDFSHNEIAFKNTKFGDKISYDYAFDIDFN